jgi:uncharacterized protein YcfJ
MRRQFAALVLSILLAGGILGADASDPPEWSNLAKVASGTLVEVTRTNQARDRGRFAGFDETSITVDAERGSIVIPRAEVSLVRIKKGSRGKRILLGAALGAAAGAAIGLIGASAGDVDIRRDIVAGASAAAGAGVGAAVGASMPSRRTVYRRPSTP